MKGVYFVQMDETGPVKIGYARGVKNRLSALQMSSPFQLFLRALVPGGREEERALHERFSDHRLRGEWFASDAPGLSELIEQNGVVLVPEGYVRADEFARICGVSVATIRRGAREGDFAHIRIGNAFYFHAEELIASLTTRASIA